jgi:prepilin-type processing-associated H-X9-DG protein
MGPTIPDFCDYAPPLTVQNAEQYRAVCQGCAFGTIRADGTFDTAHCSVAHKPTNPDICAGMLCRYYKGITLRQVPDGLSNTFMAGESLPSHHIWNCAFCDNFPVASTEIPLNLLNENSTTLTNADYYRSASGFKSMHPGGANFIMADGSVHFVPETIDYYAYNMLGSRANGDGSTSSL